MPYHYNLLPPSFAGSPFCGEPPLTTDSSLNGPFNETGISGRGQRWDTQAPKTRDSNSIPYPISTSTPITDKTLLPLPSCPFLPSAPASSSAFHSSSALPHLPLWVRSQVHFAAWSRSATTGGNLHQLCISAVQVMFPHEKDVVILKTTTVGTYSWTYQGHWPLQDHVKVHVHWAIEMLVCYWLIVLKGGVEQWDI